MDARYVSTSGLSVGSRMSGRSISKKQVRAMLGGGNQNLGFNTLVAAKINNASHISLNSPDIYDTSSRRGSVASNLGMPNPNRRGSVASQLGGNMGPPRMGRRGSVMPLNDAHGYQMPNRGAPAAPARRASAFGPGAFNIGRVMPTDEQNISVNLLVNDEETGEMEDTGFRALPKWWTDIVPNRVTALVSLVLLVTLTLFVLVYDIMYPPQ